MDCDLFKNLPSLHAKKCYLQLLEEEENVTRKQSLIILVFANIKRLFANSIFAHILNLG